MSAFISATTFSIKPGKYDEAYAEFKQWVAGYREAGAIVRVFRSVTDASGAVTITVEFPSMQAWAATQEDPRMLDVLRRLIAGEMPTVVGNIALLEELPIT